MGGGVTSIMLYACAWWSYEYDVMCSLYVHGGVTSMMSCVHCMCMVGGGVMSRMSCVCAWRVVELRA